jgi:Mg/Co/Ni transporter MgtE
LSVQLLESAAAAKKQKVNKRVEPKAAFATTFASTIFAKLLSQLLPVVQFRSTFDPAFGFQLSAFFFRKPVFH